MKYLHILSYLGIIPLKPSERSHAHAYILEAKYFKNFVKVVVLVKPKTSNIQGTPKEPDTYSGPQNII